MSSALPPPAAIKIAGQDVPHGLQLTSDIRPPRNAVAPEQLGEICCGAPGALQWSAPARQVLGATASGGILQVHVVVFFRPLSNDRSASAELNVEDQSTLPNGVWHLTAERRTREADLGDEALAKTWAQAVKTWAYLEPRQLHVVINPFSGTGRGMQIWETVVKPVLDLSPHMVQEHVTTSRGDGTRYCRELQLQLGALVAALGGDGTMSEVLNGLLSRKDAKRGAFSVCFVPGGSANAMAHLTGCGDALTAAWALAKGRLKTMDVFALHLGAFQADSSFAAMAGTEPKFGFLSMTGALIADIDIDSEVFRCCGETRFTAYAVLKIFGCCLCRCVAKVHSRLQYRYRVRWLPKVAISSLAEQSLMDARDLSKLQLRPDQPGWQSWEGDLTFFGAYAAPAISRTMHCARGTTLNDGTLNLQWKTPGGRVELVQQFDMMDEGTHLRTAEGQRNLRPTWHQADVLAVIVDHLEANSKVVIDGEALPEGSSWCAEVLPQFVSVVVGSGPLAAFGPPRRDSFGCTSNGNTMWFSSR
mmetsp:Transcript_92986/g.250943  ORF Transcript_92986/g.250943 Transcript_92986/m.250943 type:complete len:531 (-) Transcript_92986:474-2066(-)|eukprot:CAMPEP_0177274580 /NCGR_PEP_ID=MMETSP0367-20130122/67233_1 /TAXON_ID=447022 ORGANISM="Scrippsiella hangoei-like, Strain SHHI-4" /NCGR_SAMPLE_ID=MMETSP0367 /ASSEMBLY_ACC=CAM_ASM_000362 /LENGTH=530 /DNA_ID=CAMNT_0018730905 /DNA_START=45 /DNA_END=1637 /DNA_ORIENTATION=-